MLEKLFGSRTRLKLLRLFVTHPTERFFVRELTRRMDEQLNSIRRELANMESIGLVVGATEDKKRYYHVNQQWPLFGEVKALILKSQLAIEDDLVVRLKKAGSITYLALTGVFVGQDDAKTDMLIVGRCNRDKLEPIIKRLQQNFDRDIRYTILSKKEYDYRHEITDRFLFDILENKKVVLVDAEKRAANKIG